jgi:uncharacterized protein YkwD
MGDFKKLEFQIVVKAIFFVSFLLACQKQASDETKVDNVQNPGQNVNSGIPIIAAAACGAMNVFECEVLKLVNQERNNQGLASLGLLSNCITAAKAHANDMAINNYFSHDGISESWSQRMQRFGLSGSYIGENIAYGQSSPTQVMSSWMNSSGHKANILNSQFNSMGVGLAENTDGAKVWVQCFSGRNPDQ